MATEVFNYYQLAHVNGKPSKEHRNLIREGVKINPAYAEEVNANWRDNSKWYELDQEATDVYHKRSELRNQIEDDILKEKREPISPEEITREIDRIMTGGGDQNKEKHISQLNKNELIEKAKGLELVLTGKETKNDLIELIEKQKTNNNEY